jgi:hypothetical protein
LAARRKLRRLGAPLTVGPVAARTFRLPVFALECRSKSKTELWAALREWRAARRGSRDESELGRAHPKRARPERVSLPWVQQSPERLPLEPEWQQPEPQALERPELEPRQARAALLPQARALPRQAQLPEERQVSGARLR